MFEKDKKLEKFDILSFLHLIINILPFAYHDSLDTGSINKVNFFLLIQIYSLIKSITTILISLYLLFY